MLISAAQNVLGLANTGCYSHQMLIREVGRELIARGHQFAMLVSDVDEIGTEALAGVNGIDIVRFPGPPGIGTQTWAATLPQDPVQVRLNPRQPNMTDKRRPLDASAHIIHTCPHNPHLPS